jgi:branched-subunit amino acid transport protein
VSTGLIWLALFMGLVTYPSRALPILAPGIERLPAAAAEYLRLVGPAVLTALAAVSVMVAVDEGGSAAFHVGIEWLAVAFCAVLTAWRRNLLVGMIAAVVLVAVARQLGIAALPA